jgi:predicted ATPase
MESNNTIHRIVLTGGPGAGKTTAADLLRREIGEAIIIVPEAATMIFSSGFPRYKDTEARKATQSAIYHIQKNLEDVQARAYPHRTLLCDRGTLDSAVYWPDGEDSFFRAMETNLQSELKRYDAVIFFESAAVGKKAVIEGGNPTRNESVEEAALLDSQLREIWSNHPRFYHIPNHNSFIHKITTAIDCIREVIQR